jgi:hypothetical protein
MRHAPYNWDRRSSPRVAGRIIHAHQRGRIVWRLPDQFQQTRIEAQFSGHDNRRLSLLLRCSIPEKTNPPRLRESLAQQFDALSRQFELAHEDASRISTWTREAGYIALLNWIEIERNEDDRRCARSRTRRPQCRFVASGEQDVHLARGKLAISQLVAFDAWRLDVLEREIAALLITQLGHALLECNIVRRPSRHDAGITDA